MRADGSGCPIKVRKAVPPRLLSTPTSSTASQSGIMLRVPATGGGTKRHRDASGSPTLPSKRPRESSAWADEEVPRKVGPRMRLAETESSSSSGRGSPASPRAQSPPSFPPSPEAVARALPRTSSGLPVPDVGLHMIAATGIPSNHSPVRVPKRSLSPGPKDGLSRVLNVPASVATGLHTPPSSRSIAISLFGADNHDPPQERLERASLAYHTESADDERFMSAEEGPPTDVDEEMLERRRPESVAVQTVAAVAATTKCTPGQHQRLVDPPLAGSSNSGPTWLTATEPTGAHDNIDPPASDGADAELEGLSTHSRRSRGRTHADAPPAPVQQFVGKDIAPPPNMNAIDANELLHGPPAAAVFPKKRKPGRPRKQPAPDLSSSSASGAPVASTSKRNGGRPRKRPLTVATSTTPVNATEDAEPLRTEPPAAHRTSPRITIGAQPVHIDLDPAINVKTSDAPPISPSLYGWDNRLERDVLLAMSAQVERRLHLLDDEKRRMSRENHQLAARVAELEAASSQMGPPPSNGQLPTPGTDTPLGNTVAPVSPSPPASPPLPDVGFPPLAIALAPAAPVQYSQAPMSSVRDDELRHRGKWHSKRIQGESITGPCLAKHHRAAQQDLSLMNLATLAAASSAMHDASGGEFQMSDAEMRNLDRTLHRRFEANGEPAEDDMAAFEDDTAAADSATYAELVLEVKALRKAQENTIDPAIHASLVTEVETLRHLQVDRVDAPLHNKVLAQVRAASKAKAKVERRLLETAAELEKARTELDTKATDIDAERRGRQETKAALISKSSELRRSIDRVKSLEMEQARDRLALREAQTQLAQERQRDRSAAPDEVKKLTLKVDRLEADNKVLQDRLKTSATESRDKLNKAGFVVRDKDQRIQALTARVKELEEHGQANAHHYEHVSVQLYAEFEHKQDRIADLTAGNESLRKEALAWKEKWDRLESENQRLHADARAFRDQVSSIQGELKRGKDGAAALGAKCDGLQVELRRLKDEAADASRRRPELSLPIPTTLAAPSLPAYQASRASTVGSAGDASSAPRTHSAVGIALSQAMGDYSRAVPSGDALPKAAPPSTPHSTPPALAPHARPAQEANAAPYPLRTTSPPPPTISSPSPRPMRTPQPPHPAETNPVPSQAPALSRGLLASLSRHMVSKGLTPLSTAPPTAGTPVNMAPSALPPPTAASARHESLLFESPIVNIRKDDTWQPPNKGTHRSGKERSSMGERTGPLPGVAPLRVQPLQIEDDPATGAPTEHKSLVGGERIVEDVQSIDIPSCAAIYCDSSTDGHCPNLNPGLAQTHALGETAHQLSLRRSSSPGFRYSPSRPISPACAGDPPSIAESSIHAPVDTALPARPRARSPPAQGRGPRRRSRPKGAKPGRSGEDRRDRGDPVHMALPMRMTTRDARDERRERDEQAWRERGHAYWLDERRDDRDWRDERRDERDRWEPRRDGNRRGSPGYESRHERAVWRDGGGRR